MFYSFLWIEGDKQLQDFCLKRFKSKVRFLETIGHVGPCTVYLIYKHDDELDKYHEMYLLVMPDPKGTVGEGSLTDLQRMSFEEIKQARGTILRTK
jgi:hypothetical protein